MITLQSREQVTAFLEIQNWKTSVVLRELRGAVSSAKYAAAVKEAIRVLSTVEHDGVAFKDQIAAFAPTRDQVEVRRVIARHA